MPEKCRQKPTAVCESWTRELFEQEIEAHFVAGEYHAGELCEGHCGEAAGMCAAACALPVAHGVEPVVAFY